MPTLVVLILRFGADYRSNKSLFDYRSNFFSIFANISLL